ncbi:MAG: hypothetical protein K5859_03590 [Atopobiaceae bacterium]|nr:hypothetical protein [Atopobiaceae bacterium]
MARRNLMGFKPIDSIPTSRRPDKGHSIYDGILAEAAEKGGIYACQVGDSRRASNLATQIRKIVRKRELDLTVMVRNGDVYIKADR